MIATLDTDDDHERIARHLGLRKAFLSHIREKINPFVLSALDYKIQNVNSLNYDETLSPIEQVNAAMKKFGRISSAEIVTPPNVARMMLEALPDDAVTTDTVILDIAAKEGEFATAVMDYFGPKADKDKIYSLPTSTIAYEFTRKVYGLLGMPEDHVISDFITFDLLDPQKQSTIMCKLKELNIGLTLGNPPYQRDNVNNQRSHPIYPIYIDFAEELTLKGSLITPGRYLFNAGFTSKTWNKERLNSDHFKVVKYYTDSFEAFPTVDIKGGVAITYYDRESQLREKGVFYLYKELESVVKKVQDVEDIVGHNLAQLISSRGMYRFSDKLFKDHPEARESLSKGTGNMITSNSFELYPKVFLSEKPSDASSVIQVLGRENKRNYKWVRSDYILSNDFIAFYNVVLPEANGSGILGETLSTPLIISPNVGVTDTFISIGTFKKRKEAEACLKYIKTRFTRTLLGILKVTQHNPKDTWRLVPMQDFTENSDIDWSKSVEEIDRQLYRKYGLSDDEIAFIERMIKPMK